MMADLVCRLYYLTRVIGYDKETSKGLIEG